MTDLLPDGSLEAYAEMVLMRAFEEAVGQQVTSGVVHGEMHLGIGQEVVAVALKRHLAPEDCLVSTHRPHLHALAVGVDPVEMLAEIFERDGLNHGKGGHMHLFSPDAGFMCTGIVGASAPLALGYALAQERNASSGVTVVVAGDGAMNQGAVSEALNLAAVRRLAVLFLIEDNEYSISVPRAMSTAGRLASRAEALEIPSFEVDGKDYAALDDTLGEAFGVVRGDRRPVLAVCTVYRFRGHYEGDADLYRDTRERNAAMSEERDPLLRLRSHLLATEPDLQHRIDEVEVRSRRQVSDWVRAALSYPSPTDASTGAYVDD